VKNRIAAGAIAASLLTIALTGCAHQMSDQDVSTVREMACSMQNLYAQQASLGISQLNPGKFWNVGYGDSGVVEYSSTLQISGRMGDVANAYAGFAAMFPERPDPSLGVFEEDVDTFNGHIEAISVACEGNPEFEEPMVLEYPTEIEDRGYLQRVDDIEDVH